MIYLAEFATVHYFKVIKSQVFLKNVTGTGELYLGQRAFAVHDLTRV